MKKNPLWGSLVLIALAGTALQANASYSEQWMSPQQIKQEEARAPHGKSAYTCASHTTHCQAAKPASQLAVKHFAPRPHQSVKDDPISAFAANDRFPTRTVRR